MLRNLAPRGTRVFLNSETSGTVQWQSKAESNHAVVLPLSTETAPYNGHSLSSAENGDAVELGVVGSGSYLKPTTEKGAADLQNQMYELGSF
ncbi:hypothetical protein FA95DRAFT_630630 [Auriscalpium vulgare]|uniref:Uncharacterized protein n=1 Tax=Auriscalpium vulgare TaxID=40419 RepID=A0ACB8REF2_9AGAM|nr:hypothetical protein FA95DRAFT_630630 [Auriscalpium vulgare]